MFNLGVPELLLLAGIGLLLFGNRLPQLARMLGRTVVEFRRQAGSFTEELSNPAK